ncbi:hypothetical protein SAMN05216167_14422 [Spirosoma endophyticum]|uniref:Uncharacterized protein n=1 Tax=Spirosoma endophyticum TaxID=662367 RepID=A0A1I2HK85_9BACT|nr:hypothetical protein SAMN05216167_14422 [Spirosoma endophyticum]
MISLLIRIVLLIAPKRPEIGMKRAQQVPTWSMPDKSTLTINYLTKPIRLNRSMARPPAIASVSMERTLLRHGGFSNYLPRNRIECIENQTSPTKLIQGK